MLLVRTSGDEMNIVLYVHYFIHNVLFTVLFLRIVFILLPSYIQYVLHVCPPLKRDPSSVVSPLFSLFKLGMLHKSSNSLKKNCDFGLYN